MLELYRLLRLMVIGCMALAPLMASAKPCDFESNFGAGPDPETLKYMEAFERIPIQRGMGPSEVIELMGKPDESGYYDSTIPGTDAVLVIPREVAVDVGDMDFSKYLTYFKYQRDATHIDHKKDYDSTFIIDFQYGKVVHRTVGRFYYVPLFNDIRPKPKMMKPRTLTPALEKQMFGPC